MGPGVRALPRECQEAVELVESAGGIILSKPLRAGWHVPADAAVPVALAVLDDQPAVKRLVPRPDEHQVRPRRHAGSLTEAYHRALTSRATPASRVTGDRKSVV